MDNKQTQKVNGGSQQIQPNTEASGKDSLVMKAGADPDNLNEVLVFEKDSAVSHRLDLILQ